MGGFTKPLFFRVKNNPDYRKKHGTKRKKVNKMLMAIWELLFVIAMLGLIGFIMLIFGFYYGMGYAKLNEEDIKYDRRAEKLARFGSWVIENVRW